VPVRGPIPHPHGPGSVLAGSRLIVAFVASFWFRRGLSYITPHPPFRLFGQTGLGQFPSCISTRRTEVPSRHCSKGGWKFLQNSTYTR